MQFVGQHCAHAGAAMRGKRSRPLQEALIDSEGNILLHIACFYFTRKVRERLRAEAALSLQRAVEEVHRHLLQLPRGGAGDAVSLLRIQHELELFDRQLQSVGHLQRVLE